MGVSVRRVWHIVCFIIVWYGWNVPSLKGDQESEFIHLKGRIWTRPSGVIDGGRYGAAEGSETLEIAGRC